MESLPTQFAKRWRNCGIRIDNADIGIHRGPWSARVGRRDAYSFIAVLDGAVAIEHALVGRVALTAGDAWLAPPGFSYGEIIAAGTTLERFMADVTVLASPTQPDPLPRIGLPQVVSLELEALRSCITAATAESHNWRFSDETAALRARFPLDRLLLDYLAAGFAAGVFCCSEDAIPDWLLGLRHHLSTCLHRHDLSIAELAAHAGVSASHLHHAFKRAFGLPPLRFLRRLRIDVAAHLLISNRSLTIADIAVRCGYRDQSLFARHFRSITGCAPRQYRCVTDPPA